uniref:Si:ch211-283h6.4 n=1 Tax=Neogobius melanostomus TaxID=47308 RepID=A0A8C6S4U8_9GOBI
MDIIKDDELKYKPGGRLDMSHGFLHHIRRNQKARDEYDKEVKQAKELQRRRHTTTPRRPRRPDIQVYHPKRRDGSRADTGAEADECSDSGSSSDPEGDVPGTELFWLDYQSDCGTLTSVLVCKVSGKVVERVAERNTLDEPMRAALEARVQREMDKRRDKC